MTYGSGAPASSIRLMYVQRSACSVTLGTGAIPCLARIRRSAHDRRQDALANAFLVPRTAARGREHELVHVRGLALCRQQLRKLVRFEDAPGERPSVAVACRALDCS